MRTIMIIPGDVLRSGVVPFLTPLDVQSLHCIHRTMLRTLAYEWIPFSSTTCLTVDRRQPFLRVVDFCDRDSCVNYDLLASYEPSIAFRQSRLWWSYLRHCRDLLIRIAFLLFCRVIANQLHRRLHPRLIGTVGCILMGMLSALVEHVHHGLYSFSRYPQSRCMCRGATTIAYNIRPWFRGCRCPSSWTSPVCQPTTSGTTRDDWNPAQWVELVEQFTVLLVTLVAFR
jgi:hypothetical protein